MQPATQHNKHTLGSIQLGLRLLLSIYTQVSHAPISTLIDSARGCWASVPANQQDSTRSNPCLPTFGPVACKAGRPLTNDNRTTSGYLRPQMAPMGQLTAISTPLGRYGLLFV